MVKSGQKPLLPLKQGLSKQSEHIVDNVFKNLFVACAQNKFTYSRRRYIQRPGYIGAAESHLVDCNDADDGATARDRSSSASAPYFIFINLKISRYRIN